MKDIVISIIFFIWTVFAITGSGRIILKKIKLIPNNKEFSWLASIGTGCGLLIFLMIILGVLGLYHRISAISLLLGMTALTIFTVRDFKLPKILAIRRMRKFDIFLLLLIIVSAFLNFLDCFTTPYQFDVRQLHFYLPKLYQQSGGLIYDPNFIYMGMPCNIEILYTYGFLVSGEHLARLINWGFGIALCWSLYVLCRNYVSKRAALTGAAFFYLMTITVYYSNRTKSDLGLIFFEILVFHYVLYWLSTRKYKALVMMGIFCGLALGSKYTALPLCLVPITIFLVLRWFIFDRENIVKYFKSVFIFGVIALVIGSPWYIRNYWVTGNPIEPLYCGKYEKSTIAPDTAKKLTPPKYKRRKIINKNLDYFSLPILWTINDSTDDFKAGEGRIGPIILLFLPLILLFRKAKERIIKYMLLFLCIYYICVLTFTYPVTRYAYTMLALCCVLAGHVFNLVVEKYSKILRSLLYSLVVLILLLQFVCGPAAYNYFSIKGLFMSKSDYLTAHLGNEYRVYQYLNNEIIDNNVKFFGVYNGTSYLCKKQILFGLTKNEAEIAYYKDENINDLNYESIRSIHEKMLSRNIKYIIKPPDNFPSAKEVDNCVFFAKDYKDQFLDEVIKFSEDENSEEWTIYKLKEILNNG